MLQQTRVETVLPYFERFMRELPNVHALAECSLDRVLSLWSGLGYYRRARMLHAAARTVVDEFDGVVPNDTKELRRLPGVGRYTAGAIASLAFGRRVPVVDGNVARVVARVFAVDSDLGGARGIARIWELAEEIVVPPGIDPGIVNQSLMELGATVCVPREPKCGQCPLRAQCAAYRTGRVDELPRMAPKRAPVNMRQTALVISSKNQVILARRGLAGLFGGLWEPPTTQGDVATLAKALGVSTNQLRSVGFVDHVLSHRRMHVEVIVGPLARRRTFTNPGSNYDAIEAVRWMAVAELPQSALTRKVLNLATPGRTSLR
jgi:A/G-specific adenine glycosylase